MCKYGVKPVVIGPSVLQPAVIRRWNWYFDIILPLMIEIVDFM